MIEFFKEYAEDITFGDKYKVRKLSPLWWAIMGGFAVITLSCFWIIISYGAIL